MSEECRDLSYAVRFVEHLIRTGAPAMAEVAAPPEAWTGKYGDNGHWLGNVIKDLLNRKVIEKTGGASDREFVCRIAARPSRKGGVAGVWRIMSQTNAEDFLGRAKARLALLPTLPPPPCQGELFAAAEQQPA